MDQFLRPDVSMADDEKRTEQRSVLRRAGRTIAASLAIVASLLAFPSGIPWMIAFWLAWHSALVLRGQPGRLPLAACATVVLVKRLPPAPGMAVLAAAAVVFEVATSWQSWRTKPAGEHEVRVAQSWI